MFGLPVSISTCHVLLANCVTWYSMDDDSLRKEAEHNLALDGLGLCVAPGSQAFHLALKILMSQLSTSSLVHVHFTLILF